MLIVLAVIISLTKINKSNNTQIMAYLTKCNQSYSPWSRQGSQKLASSSFPDPFLISMRSMYVFALISDTVSNTNHTSLPWISQVVVFPASFFLRMKCSDYEIVILYGIFHAAKPNYLFFSPNSSVYNQALEMPKTKIWLKRKNQAYSLVLFRG